MGLLDRRREAKAEREVVNARRLAAADLADWQEADDELVDMLDTAKTYTGDTDVDLILKKGERAFQVIDGSCLIEPRRLPGQWQGRSSGYSFHVAKGVNYRIGASRGTFVQGEETPQVIDQGVVTITDQRVVFQGTKASREWLFPKLLGVQHVELPKTPWTALQVSNRQKVSGFIYTRDVAEGIRFRLSLALARFHGEADVAEMVENLEAQLAEHRAQRPAALGAGAPPAGELPPASPFNRA